MQRFRWISILAAACAFPFAAFAGVTLTFTSKIPVGAFAVGSGSKVTIQFDGAEPTKGLFLARIEKNDAPAQWMVLRLDEKRVFLIDENALTSVPEKLDQYQKLADPIEQEGGTCAAFAMYHHTIQLEKDDLVRLGLNEEGRMKLLANYLSEYYLNGRRRFSVRGIMDSVGKKYGFRCNTKKFDDAKKAVAWTRKSLQAGLPVLVEFNVGPDMVSSSYDIVDFEQRTLKDPRLWLPQKSGEDAAGGHAIVLVSEFMASRQAKALVMDSDWSEPRIWELSKYIGPQTKMDEMLFHTCQAAN